MITKVPEFYLDHEVRLRVHDERFKQMESIVKETQYLTRALLGTAITAIVLPIVLHHYGLI